MEFEYYDPSDDKRSCVVRTLTKLTGKSNPHAGTPFPIRAYNI